MSRRRRLPSKTFLSTFNFELLNFRVPIWSYIIVAVAAYLLGSIPTGFLVGKVKGIDIRKTGSGNIGATNSFRVLGKAAGIFVLLVDCAKGFAACKFAVYFAAHFTIRFYESRPDPDIVAQMNWALEPFAIIAGIFAVLGHNYTCWLKFKGGKGIATTAGVYLALAPEALGIAFVVFILAVLITRYMSVGSICAAIALPIAVYWTQDNDVLNMVTLVLGVMAIYKHKSNIQRLMAGTENRLGKKVGQASSLSDRQDACPTKSEDAK